MNIEEKIQSESRKLSDFYYPYYMEERYPGAMDNFTPINTKFWQNKVYYAYKKWFERAARLFCVRQEYDAEKVIQAFMLDGFKYPQQLGVENFWDTYLKYLPGLHTKKSEETEVVENIVNAVLELRKYETVKKWLDLKINQKLIVENEIKFEPTLLAFSDAFIDFCNKKCEGIYNFEKMRNKVFKQKSSDKIVAKIRNFLQDDYYTYNEELTKQLKDEGIIF